MKYILYKNFSLKETNFKKFIHTKSSERQFFFNENTLTNKYLYKQNKSKLSLISQIDGNPVVFYVDGDYTIPSNTTFIPTNRCKGLYMFINGTLTNNDTISMTARGANSE